MYFSVTYMDADRVLVPLPYKSYNGALYLHFVNRRYNNLRLVDFIFLKV